MMALNHVVFAMISIPIFLRYAPLRKLISAS